MRDVKWRTGYSWQSMQRCLANNLRQRATTRDNAYLSSGMWKTCSIFPPHIVLQKNPTQDTVLPSLMPSWWGIEGRVRQNRGVQGRTRITDMESQMPCFYFPCIVQWMDNHQGSTFDGTEMQCHSVLTFKIQAESHPVREPKLPAWHRILAYLPSWCFLRVIATFMYRVRLEKFCKATYRSQKIICVSNYSDMPNTVVSDYCKIEFYEGIVVPYCVWFYNSCGPIR